MTLENKINQYKDIGFETKPLITYVFENNVLLYRMPLDYRKGYFINERA